MESPTERPQDSVVIVGGRKGEVVDIALRSKACYKVGGNSFCSPPKIISLLCLVIMIQVVGLVFLVVDKIGLQEQREKISTSKEENVLIINSTIERPDYYEEYGGESEFSEMTPPNIENMDDMQRMMYSMEPRCFSLCEPAELFFRLVN